MPDGAEIRAARGGIVGDVVGDLTQNFNPCDPATPNADGLGNYVRIDHQDGTFGYYVHLKANTVPLEVGDEIKRGDEIGQADNTGPILRAVPPLPGRHREHAAVLRPDDPDPGSRPGSSSRARPSPRCRAATSP